MNLIWKSVTALFAVWMSAQLSSCTSSSSKPNVQSHLDHKNWDGHIKESLTYDEFIKFLQQSDSHNPFRSTQNCLFSHSKQENPSHFIFHGKFEPAIRPLPPAEENLVTIKNSSNHFQAFTPWARIGDIKSDLSVATFTPLPAPGENDLLGLWILKNKILLRSTSKDFLSREFTDTEQLVLTLQEYFSKQNYTALLLIPDSKLSLKSLIEVSSVLKRLPEVSFTLATTIDHSVSLATDSVSSNKQGKYFCTDEVYRLEEDEKEGQLSQEKIQNTLRTATVQNLENCLNQTKFEKNGGKAKIFLRINHNGEISKACFIKSDFSELSSHLCIIQNLKSIQFPKPNPSGVVDVHLPLSLQPNNDVSFKFFCAN